MRIAKRTQAIKPFLVMDVLERAHQLEDEGKRVIHLEIGEPDFNTPDCIKQAAAKAMAENRTHYTHSLGIPALRRAVCEHYGETYGVDMDPDRVVVTQGTSPGMFAVFSTLCEDGDEVIMSDPGYACYSNFIEFAGARAVRVRVHEDDAFQYRVSAIRDALSDKTRAILINSPSNPTGTLLDPERMRRIADLGVTVVSDEIYHGLVYEGKACSILEFTDNALVFNGFSKLYAMTGFRLGYVIAPEECIRPLQKLCQSFFISANTMAQWAGVAALTNKCEEIEEMRRTYDKRRKYLLKRLKGMGLSISHDPTGAFYALVDFSSVNPDSYALAFDILEKASVACTPGIDFGPGAEGYLRFSYANSIENIEQGMDRLEKYLEEARKG